MESETTVPSTLLEANLLYSNPQACHDLMVSVRWPDGVECPRCGSERVTLFATKPLFKCNGCKKQFTVKLGTIFEDSPLGLDKWLPAVWLITNAKNGVSSCELARSLGVTQKTAWFMLHRIRHAMKQGGFEKMSGTIEADETFVGGLEKNKHNDKKLKQGRGTVGKAIVAGVLERGKEGAKSKVRAKVVKDTKSSTLKGNVKEIVEPGSNLNTDAFRGYRGLNGEYVHQWVDHAVKYAEGAVHTNGMENFWSLLKRGLKGTYVAVQPFHLSRYVDEQAWRFNYRGLNDGERFMMVMNSIAGRRLTYATLTTAYEAYYAEIMP